MAVTPASDIEAEIIEKLRENDEETRAHVYEVANAAAEYARSIAPVSPFGARDPAPGHFRDSIYATQAPDYDGLPAAQVRSDLRESVFIEYGTSRTPEHATFAKTTAHFEGTPGVDLQYITKGRSLSRYPKLT